jgi:glycosyltransferase involved in cell wall biosynthesis
MNNKKAYIILATYNPDCVFFKKQIQSISQQSYTNWKCLINDDRSDEEIAIRIKEIISEDDRFLFRQNKRRVGVFHNFEAGLNEVDKDAEYIFYCDQDDVWKQNKIEFCINEFKDEEVMLVHSDMEMIDENDTLIYPSCFKFENRDLSDLSVAQLVVKNVVTGCTLGFRRSLLANILPFPDLGRHPSYHHDLWTALHAASVGKIKTITKPLIEYRQHRKNVIGAIRPTWLTRFRNGRAIDEWLLRKKIIWHLVSSNFHQRTNNPSIGKVGRWMKNRPANFSMTVHVLKLALQGKPDAIIGIKMVVGKAMEFFSFLTRKLFTSPRKISIAFRIMRELFKRDFIRSCKKALAPVIKSNPNIFPLSKYPYYNAGVEYIIEGQFIIHSFSEKGPNINIVLPNLKPEYIFGGVSTAIRLGIKLAGLGHSVNFVSADTSVSEKDSSLIKDLLRTRFQASDAEMNLISLVDGFGGPVDKTFSINDVFVATFWPTAYKINNALKKHPFLNKRFFYLIQDYEPGFYSWSDEYALVEATYRMNYEGIYNTSILADYFMRHNYSYINNNLIIQPEIEWSRYSPPTAEDIRDRDKKRILIYGRPNTDRNLFRTIVTSLRIWIQENHITPEQVEVLSAGETHLAVELGNYIEMKSVGKLTMEEYAKLLRRSDLGISLMLSPHPSYPPFDMTASGMMVITNIYENKRMNLSPNFINTYANPTDIATEIKLNWHKLDDAEARIQGSTYSIKELGHSMDHVINEISRIFNNKMTRDN